MGVTFDSEFIRRLEYLDILARKIFAGLLRAERQSQKKGVSVEFSDYRNYTPGDDVRYVDWNIFARQEELLLKLFREEENLPLSIFIDCSASMDFGSPNKFDYARTVAAALAYIGLANMDSLNLMTYAGGLGQYLRAVKGKKSIFQVFNFIEDLHTSPETRLDQALTQYLSLVHRKGVQIIISDFYAFDSAVKALQAVSFMQNDVFLIHVVDPWEEDPGVTGEYRLRDVERGDMENITLTRSLLKRYRRAFEGHAAAIESASRRHEWGYLRARTSVGYDDLILRLLRRRKLVG
jgi:uncharacterized protein (DUF58 family)